MEIFKKISTYITEVFCLFVINFYIFFAAQPSNQSPMSLTSDASSPRSYVSPRISTPQTNTVPIKPLISTPPVSSQPKVCCL